MSKRRELQDRVESLEAKLIKLDTRLSNKLFIERAPQSTVKFVEKEKKDTIQELNKINRVLNGYDNLDSLYY